MLRHKSFAVGEMTVDEAIDDLEALDHGFYLFRNLDTGEDAVIARAGNGTYELHEDLARTPDDEIVAPVTRSPVTPPVVSLDEAREELDETERPFVFFVDPDDGRGRVLYRRYDGHYGLIEPNEVM